MTALPVTLVFMTYLCPLGVCLDMSCLVWYPGRLISLGGGALGYCTTDCKQANTGGTDLRRSNETVIKHGCGDLVLVSLKTTSGPRVPDERLNIGMHYCQMPICCHL